MSSPPPAKRTIPMDDFVQRLQKEDRNQETAIKHLDEQLRAATADLLAVAEDRDDKAEMLSRLVMRGYEREERILELKKELAQMKGDEQGPKDAERLAAQLVEMKANWERIQREKKKKGVEDGEVGEASAILMSMREG